MSVINKMLRDLDQQAGQAFSSAAPLGPGRAFSLAFAQGTRVVHVAESTHQMRWHRVSVVALAVLVLVGLGAYADRSTQPGAWITGESSKSQQVPASQPQEAGASPVKPALSGVPAAPVAAPVGLTSAAALMTADKTAPSTTVGVRSHGRAHLRQNLEKKAVLPSRNLETSTQNVEQMQGPGVASDAPSSAVSTADNHASVHVADKLLAQAAQEMLVQAQALWSTGARDAATVLLTDVLARLDRSVASDASTAAAQGRVALALARYRSMLGQTQQVVDLLVQHEAVLAQTAEAWALRANAAQRLGQHVQAVHSYEQALGLKPRVPRWMLGAAVSLALRGQIQAAQEWVTQAQAVEPLQADMAGYLHQLGVDTSAR